MVCKPIPCSSTVWVLLQPTSHYSCYKVGEGTIDATKQIEGFNLQREGDNCYCNKIKSFNLQRKERGILTVADQGVQSAEGERARYSCCSKPKGSICRVRETIVVAAKSNGSICKGRETDILLEANPKGSICRGRKTHTYTPLHSCYSKAKPSICRGREKFLLAAAADQSFNLRGGRKTHTYTHLHSYCSKAKPSICRGREKFSLAAAADQNFNLRGPTLHSYEKNKIFPLVWRLDEILWSDPFAILQVAATI